MLPDLFNAISTKALTLIFTKQLRDQVLPVWWDLKAVLFKVWELYLGFSDELEHEFLLLVREWGDSYQQFVYEDT